VCVLIILNLQDFVLFHNVEVATKILKVEREGDTCDRKHRISKILRDAAQMYQTFDADNEFLRFLYVLKFRTNVYKSGLALSLAGNPHCFEIQSGYQHGTVKNYFTVEFRSFQMTLIQGLPESESE
jgi:hypothetical protein